MKSAVILFLIFLQPLMSYAHPGKTDRYGGHRCLRGCDEWGLFYKEYHLHDKDGRPIRVKPNKEDVKESGIGAVVEQVSEPTNTIVQAAKPVSEVVTTNRYITNVYEENVILSNPLIAVLLMLLLMLLLFKMNREKNKE